MYYCFENCNQMRVSIEHCMQNEKKYMFKKLVLQNLK